MHLKDLPGVSDLRLCGRKSRHRHTEGGAGDIVQSDVMAELHGGGISAVLSADSDMELRIRRSSEIDRHLHKLPYALLVELCEGIRLEDLRVIVGV